MPTSPPRCSPRQPGLALACLLVALAAGCPPRPRAPALEDTRVYRNDREGFRFLVPDGWSQHAKSEVPPGPAETEQLLTLYNAFTTEAPASFEVSLIDLPESADVGAYLADSPRQGVRWRLRSGPKEVRAGGAPASRYLLVGRDRGKDMEREVVAVRRGGRVYLFSGVFRASDKSAREQVRRAVDSLEWKR